VFSPAYHVDRYFMRPQKEHLSLYGNSKLFGIAQFVVALGLSLALAGCGSDSKPDPTPTATTTPEPTVGELADRIAAAWTGVSTYRMVSRNVEAAGTPVAQGQAEIVYEVVMPDRKHWISISEGKVISESVVIGSDVYLRGSSTEPVTPGAGGWFAVDPASLDPESQEAMQIEAIMGPVLPPYAGLSQDERGRTAKPLGAINVNGQECQAYQIVDTTETGERVDVTLAMNVDDLPCSIQTKVSGVDYLTTFEFNIPLTIAAPIINVKPFQ
jgi:hypothetical protein